MGTAKKVAEKVFDDACDVLQEVGLELDSPNALREKAGKRRVEANQLEPTSSFPIEEVERLKKKQLSTVKKLLLYADELAKLLEYICEKSGGNIGYDEVSNRLHVMSGYVKEMVERERNRQRSPLDPFDEVYRFPMLGIGGTSPELLGKGRGATKAEFDEILSLVREYAEKRVIGFSSIPVLMAEKGGLGHESYFLNTKKMVEELPPNFPIFTCFSGESSERLRWLASVANAYDSYCPNNKPLGVDFEHFLKMLRSAQAGNRIRITAMPQYPNNGNTPHILLVVAFASYFGMRACCTAINPDGKFPSGVMPEVILRDRKTDPFGSCVMNALLGQTLRELGISAHISVGSPTIHEADVDGAFIDVKKSTDFLNTFGDGLYIRHNIGHTRGLVCFSPELARKACEYIEHSRNILQPQMSLLERLTLEGDIKEVLSKPCSEWTSPYAVVSPAEIFGLS